MSNFYVIEVMDKLEGFTHYFQSKDDAEKIALNIHMLFRPDSVVVYEEICTPALDDSGEAIDIGVDRVEILSYIKADA